MKTPWQLLAAILLCSVSAADLLAQDEPFVMTELNQKPNPPNRYRLGHPYEILYGPDHYLYITEKVGRVIRVDTGTGIRQVILDHRANVALTISRNGSGAATSIGQNGMMGMAFHPNFGQGTGQDSVYIAYTYTTTQARISRFKFNAGTPPSLTGETILISGLPANDDHSSGRLIFGADGKLYYSCGDRGANQFGNRCLPILSQEDPTAGQVAAQNYTNYSGKILRMNSDGSIPDDNPLFNGVRSHVFSKGHRNPQGLVWEKAPSNGFSMPVLQTGGKLFSSEHGPRTDDELNIIEGGMNYGWPYVAGDTDNVNYQYVNWSSASPANCNATAYTENAVPPGATILQESDAPAELKAAFRKPILSMHESCGTQTSATCDAGGTNWMKFATIAPSSIDYYHVNSGMGIPGWYPSVLIPTLRKGTLYRVKLSADRSGAVSDTIPYFATVNRYRDMAISPDGNTIYIITDSIGSTSGPSGSGTSSLANRGSILKFQYAGNVLLNREDQPKPERPAVQTRTLVYPNPARDEIFVEIALQRTAPFRYTLHDASGRSLRQGQTSLRAFSIPVSTLQRGIYFLKLTDSRGQELLMERVLLQ